MAGNYYPPFSLRISEELLDKIKYIAEENKRSANKEIEFVLEQYVKKYEKENGKIDWKPPKKVVFYYKKKRSHFCNLFKVNF